MKKIVALPLALLLLAGLSISFTNNYADADAGIGLPVKFPKKVDAIIKDKCYGCHSPDAKGDKSKAALNWDELGGLDYAGQLEKFKGISKVMSEGSMPPKMMVEKMPEKALSAAETALMSKWAGKMVKKADKKMKKMM